MNNFLIIVISVVLNSAAQLFIKQGVANMEKFTFSIRSVFALALYAATSIPILIGLVCYVLSFGLWIVVLSRVNVSLAYPLLSIGYIFTAVFAYFLFNEPFTWQKSVGILTICLGVFILSLSKG